MTRCHSSKRAFTLIELLVVMAIIALLIGLLLPTLAGARERGREAVCLANARSLQLANTLYAEDHTGSFAPGAADFLRNLSRWHGTRERASEAFTPAGAPLTPYLSGAGASEAVRACPTFARTLTILRDARQGFEASSGGYGYNNAYVGEVRVRRASAQMVLKSDRAGASVHRFVSPRETLAFSDAAFASQNRTGNVIEYSFAEPPYRPDDDRFDMDPSIHFRHGGRAGGTATIAWLDGHADAQRLSRSWSSGIYTPEPVSVGIGWFDELRSNRFFDER
ncbi:MAG: prepilin-type N-terminal cleavage/methylation domain-containing protein [Phycisphaerales bacterium]|jgi:prepilin-type N-terminal cleavage/methylation domain-containing protein/prepilin-type processing-associated H-X9-DG protein|nr:prepilin-type N-terminal cleavage/methylation domain-containing protein [Phycisphaerales bacterium]